VDRPLVPADPENLDLLASVAATHMPTQHLTIDSKNGDITTE